VREAAVVGLPDAIWGETIGLCVVAARAVTSDELVVFCREHLGPFKIPEHVLFLDQLPRNAMGKVVRADVRRAFEGATVTP
jgi:acyl-coenzyme A synthetase/AMP-(fatty) acid ligase